MGVDKSFIRNFSFLWISCLSICASFIDKIVNHGIWVFHSWDYDCLKFNLILILRAKQIQDKKVEIEKKRFSWKIEAVNHSNTSYCINLFILFFFLLSWIVSLELDGKQMFLSFLYLIFSLNLNFTWTFMETNLHWDMNTFILFYIFISIFKCALALSDL